LLLLLTFLYPHVTPVAYLFGLFQQCSAESTCCWFLPNSTAVQKIFSISCSTFHCMCLNLIPRAGYLVYSMLYHVADSICFYFSLVCSEYPFLKLCIFVHLIFFLLSRYYSNSSDLCLFFLFIYVAILLNTWCFELGLGSWGWHGNTVTFLFLIWNVLLHLIPQNKIKESKPEYTSCLW